MSNSRKYRSTLRPGFAVTAALLAVSPVVAQVAEHPNLSGIWEPRDGSLKVIVKPDFTEEGKKILSGPTKDTDPNGVDESAIYCMPLQQPWNLVQSAPIDIVQDARETNMVYEQRTLPFHIFTDGRPHRPSSEPLTLNGDAVGRWEGDEFVVDTIGFAARPGHHPVWFMPVGPTLHTNMRFSLAAGGQELHAHAVIEDPHVLKQPFVYDFVWYRAKQGEYSRPEACDARNSANSRY